MVLNSYDNLSLQIRHFVTSSSFQNFIISLIVISSILLGFETSEPMMSSYGSIIKSIDTIIITFFTVEIILKLISYGRKPLNYFKDSWNVLDFFIVAGCLMPSGSSVIAVFRLVRVLRVFRLLTALPKLQIIISGLLKSIPSMGYVILLLSMHFYMYSILGTFLFGKNDPVHFGTLTHSMLTLFQTLTLEGWVDYLRIQMYGCANYGYSDFQSQCIASQARPYAAVLYFISFIVTGTMFILNLLVGAVVNGMSESNQEAMNQKSEAEFETQEQSIAKLTAEVRQLRERLDKRAS